MDVVYVGVFEYESVFTPNEDGTSLVQSFLHKLTD